MKNLKKVETLVVVLWIVLAVLICVRFLSDNTAQKATSTTTEPSCISRSVNPMYNQMYRDVRFNESRQADSLVNEIGATGHLQYTPVRVRGVNKLFETDYVLEDFLDEKLSYRVFIKVQMVRNPQADWEFGIRDWASPSNHYAALTSARMEVIRGRERK